MSLEIRVALLLIAVVCSPPSDHLVMLPDNFTGNICVLIVSSHTGRCHNCKIPTLDVVLPFLRLTLHASSHCREEMPDEVPN